MPRRLEREVHLKDLWNAFWQWAYGKLLEAAVTPPGGAGVVLELGTFGTSVADDEAKTRGQIVAFARAQVGEPYHFGAEGPADKDLERWDCSELVEHSYAAGGKTIPDGSGAQRAFCQRVFEPQPGDLACFDPSAPTPQHPNGVGHVELYAGGGVVIGARSKRQGGVQVGKVVELTREEVEAHPRFAGWYRHPDFARPPEDRA